MEKSKTTIVGFVSIEPVGAIEDTALLVSEAIPGLVLERDTSGVYEEFAAFTGKLFGLKFALLGNPSIGETFDNFELNISTENTESDKWYDISEHLCAQLNASEKLRCCVLNENEG